MKINLDGTDRVTSILRDSIETENVLTKQLDSARFFAENAASWGLEELQEVIISNDAETVRYFAGFVDHLTEYARGSYLDYDVECTDYTFLLEHPEALVNAEYTDQTDQAIIADFMATACPDIEATTYVEELRTLEEVRFPRMTPREVLEVLADLSGGDWYVDYGPAPGAQKAYLHYFSSETNSAPHDLSDSPDMATSYPYGEMTQETWSPTANLVEVVGGDYLSSDQTGYLSGNSEATEILTPYKLRAPTVGSVLVWRNDGDDAAPSWTALTVGTGHLHDIADYDCLLFFNEKYLEFAAAPPNLKLAVKFTARQEIPVRVRVRDYVSYATYGRWLAKVVTDSEITSKDVARRRGKAELAKLSTAQPSFKLRTRHAGLLAGQRVKLVSSVRGLDAYYLIQRVVSRFEGGDYANYAVELGLYNPDLVDLIVGLKRQQRTSWSEDEVLDELLETAESFALADSSSITGTGPVYKWGPYSGVDTEMRWGFFVWAGLWTVAQSVIGGADSIKWTGLWLIGRSCVGGEDRIT